MLLHEVWNKRGDMQPQLQLLRLFLHCCFLLQPCLLTLLCANAKALLLQQETIGRPTPRRLERENKSRRGSTS